MMAFFGKSDRTTHAYSAIMARPESDQQEDYTPKGCRLDRVNTRIRAGETDEVIAAAESVTIDYVRIARRLMNGTTTNITRTPNKVLGLQKKWTRPSGVDIKLVIAHRYDGASYGKLAARYGLAISTVRDRIKRCEKWEAKNHKRIGPEGVEDCD